jgi:hypothetical protein
MHPRAQGAASLGNGVGGPGLCLPGALARLRDLCYQKAGELSS